MSLLKLPFWSNAFVMNDSPSLVAFPELRNVNIALYELSSIDNSYKFTVLGDTACRRINAPTMIQKEFLLIMLSSRAS